MNRSSKLGLAALLAAALAACGGKAATKPEPAKPVAAKPAIPVATKPAAKPGAAPAKPGDAAAAKPAEPEAPPKTPDEQFKDALAALKAKNFEEARSGFEKLAKEHPEFAGPLSNLGVLDAKQGKREAAIADFTRAAAANPQNAMAYNWLGLLYRESKAYPEAEKAYLRALEIKKDYAQAQLNLGILYEVYLNRPGQALTRYRAYQQLTGNKELKVAAWIKGLEEAGVADPASNAPAVVPPAPAAPAAPAAKEKKKA